MIGDDDPVGESKPSQEGTSKLALDGNIVPFERRQPAEPVIFSRSAALRVAAKSASAGVRPASTINANSCALTPREVSVPKAIFTPALYAPPSMPFISGVTSRAFCAAEGLSWSGCLSAISCTWFATSRVGTR